jgi:5,10-methylene-tetrahydrofolate dehydrogenase/methenyl tetrahydrofolate cyclohydrolase
MTAQLIDGKAIAQKVREEVAAEVTKRTAEGKPQPVLATVLVGDRPDSASYVASKGKACMELGMGSISEHLPADATQGQVEELVKRLNADPAVNGILVQLPMPAHIDEERVLSLISIEKDVDGFSPINIGRLAQKGRKPLFVPCTPYGCIYLLDQAGVKIEGANAVVLGRSNIVGMPAALLLIGRNATVTVCHSRTRDIAAVVRDATKKSGHRLVGDVHFNEAKEVAGFITPVPGGVGPMTIAMLMKNTLRASQIQHP